MGFIHPENKSGKGGFYLFDDNTGLRYPDFYKEGTVLDAKYKRLGDYSRVAAYRLPKILPLTLISVQL